MAAAAFFSHMQATSSKGPKAQAVPPWVEKYRPKNMDEVVYQEEVVSVLKKSVETNEFPHLLFYGPPGTGKTSTILAIARELYGPQLIKERVLELNASDERGIDVIRTKVKNFAQVAVGNKVAKGYPSPPFKIIILDEADSMTADAQSALRRTMEVHSKVTRFCLICNYVTRIIEPLASRCAKFRFRPLTIEAIGAHLKNIAEKEGANVSEGAVGEIVRVSGGDMRKAITLLQSCSRWRGEDDVTAQDVTDISGSVPPAVIQSLLSTCRSQSYEKVQSAVNDVIADGYSASVLIDQLYDAVVTDGAITHIQKAKIAAKLAETDKCLLDGADEALQLLSLLAVIVDTLK